MNILGTAVAALLNSLWQSAAVALLVWAAFRFLPRLNVQINAATRCAVWWAVLAAVVLLPMAPQQVKVPRKVAEVPLASAGSTAIPVTIAPAPVVSTPVASAAPAPPASGPLEITAGAGLLAIFAIWSTLSLFRIAQIIRSYRYLRGIKQRSRAVSPERMLNFNYWLLACGVDRTARLLVSSDIVSPMAVGFRRPAVIVPETLMNEFTPEELDHVLLHELAHLARYDDWTNLFARLIGALLPIHPVAVWLVKQIEQDREAACDDWVVAMTGEARPYAASLTRLFELCSARRRQLLATGMAGRASHLGERIEALLRGGRDFAPRVSLLRVALGAGILLGLVLVCAQAPHWVAFAQQPAFAQEPPTPPAAPAPVPPAPLTPPTVPSTAPAAAPTAPPAPPVPAALPERSEFENRLRNNQQTLQFLQDEIKERGRKLAPDHPDMVRLRNQIRAAEAAMQAQKAQMFAMQAQLRAQNEQRRAAPQSPNGSFLAALVAAGYGGISVDEIIELREHGVTPEFLRAVGDAGLGKLAPKELVALANNGVNPDLVRALRQAFPQITVREMVEAAQQGINQRDLREAKEFSPNLTLPQIIKLKQAGVL